MKKTKKFISLLFPLLALTLCGCGGNNPNVPDDPIVEPGISDYYNEKNFLSSDRIVTETKLVIYDGPSLLETSKKVAVKVNDNNLFVYETRVNHGTKFSWDVPETTAPFVNFDFEGKVRVEIEVLEDVVVESAIVTPLVYGIAPAVQNNKIIFDLSYTGNYTVEYNGNPDTAIHIFANPLETDIMTKEEAKADSKKVYVGPGVYNAGAFPISDGTEIYLAGGSYVYGQFSAENVKDVKIFGRGIVSGSIFNRRSESEYYLPVVFRKSENIVINDLCFVDPAGWVMTFWQSKNITINNPKIITARQNGDGISIQSCEKVRINGGFVRTWDDSLVVKNADRGVTKDVIFDGVTVWTDLAQSMEVGYETNGPTMDDITFQNITVLHNFHKALISSHNCDDAVIKNVTYKNITLEDGQMLGDDRNDGENDFLMDFTIAYNTDWTKSGGERGVIDGVNIENVNVYKLLPTITSRFLGESNASKISNVSIKGIMIAGSMKNTIDSLQIATNQYTSNITVSKMDEVLGAIIQLPYKLNLNNSNVKITKKENITQTGMLVPEFSHMQGELPYIGPKTQVGVTSKVTHGVGSKATTPVDDGTSSDFTKEGSSIGNIFDNDSSTKWESGAWTGEEKEFAGITMDFDVPKIVGKIRVVGPSDNIYFFTYGIEIWVRKLKTDGTMNEKYLRLNPLTEYEMTPTNGNVIDININGALYGGIQFRLFKLDSASAPTRYTIGEIEFYSPALTYNKAIVESTEHNDVYNVEKAVDGEANGTSYYESAALPATIVVDMGDVYSITTIVLCLPPSLKWSARTQNIGFYGSDSNTAYSKDSTKFTEILPAKDYLFDPLTGNRVTIDLTTPFSCRYFKIVINSNDTAGGYLGQVSEICVYGN